MLDCRLTSDFYNRSGGLIHPDRLYLTAKAVPADVPQAPLARISPIPANWIDFNYPEVAPIFHGPVFRGLKETSGDPQRGQHPRYGASAGRFGGRSTRFGLGDSFLRAGFGHVFVCHALVVF